MRRMLPWRQDRSADWKEALNAVSSSIARNENPKKQHPHTHNQRIRRNILRQLRTAEEWAGRLHSIEVFLDQIEQDYLCIQPLSFSEEPPMKESERDNIDQQLAKQLAEAVKGIERFRAVANTELSKRQAASPEHQIGEASEKMAGLEVVFMNGMDAEYNLLGVAKALIDRLNALHHRIGTIQTERLKRTTEMRAPFAKWAVNIVGEDVVNIRDQANSSNGLSMTLSDGSGISLGRLPPPFADETHKYRQPNDILRVLTRFMTSNEMRTKAGVSRCEGAVGAEDFAYALLLAIAEEAMKSKLADESSSGAEVIKENFEREINVTARCVIQSTSLLSESVKETICAPSSKSMDSDGIHSPCIAEFALILRFIRACLSVSNIDRATWRARHKRFDVETAAQPLIIPSAVMTWADLKVGISETNADHELALTQSIVPPSLGRFYETLLCHGGDGVFVRHRDFDEQPDGPAVTAMPSKMGTEGARKAKTPRGLSAATERSSRTAQSALNAIVESRPDKLYSAAKVSDTCNSDGEAASTPQPSKLDLMQMTPKSESHLTPTNHRQQLSLLERENVELVESLKGELDDVVKVEEQMRNVRELIQRFGQHVIQQEESLADVHDATSNVMDNVDEGLTQLEKAAKASQTSANLQFTAIIVLTVILIFLDSFVF